MDIVLFDASVEGCSFRGCAENALSCRTALLPHTSDRAVLRCVSALALPFDDGRFSGAPTRRCRIRLQRPGSLYRALRKHNINKVLKPRGIDQD